MARRRSIRHVLPAEIPIACDHAKDQGLGGEGRRPVCYLRCTPLEIIHALERHLPLARPATRSARAARAPWRKRYFATADVLAVLAFLDVAPTVYVREMVRPRDLRHA